jgi:ribosomal-protein-alanine N-acetyltransferase
MHLLKFHLEKSCILFDIHHMLSPSLSTLRCNLRPVMRTDYADLLDLHQNQNVRLFLGGTLRAEDFIRKFESMLSVQDHFQWAARLKETEEFVGLFSLDRHHEGCDIELSYQLAENMQKKGLALEITKHLIDFAFEKLKLTRLVAETQTANTASVRLLGKLGMKFERTANRFGAQQSIFVIHNALN